ncbi:olfactory receptor 52K2-like [Megalops cyprinoides]|uniref:olfactory receptor 52K2-like n=1 Tax=Megalops cyprinoides TaxID=118141 RepID=UPI0018640C2F|nr:olfactory receptor 52K2-like [Megalops cyprinoides]
MEGYPDRNISHTSFILMGFHGLKEGRRLLFIPFFLMFLLSLFANSMLIFIITSTRTLHSPMYILIGVMAVVDFILPIFFVPHMLLSFLLDWNGISLVGCLTQMFHIHFIGSFQSTLLVWMALDRYFAICMPLRYNDFMAVTPFLKFVIAPVLRNAILNLAMVSLAGSRSYCLSNVIHHCFCEHMALVNLGCGDISTSNIVGLIAALSIPTADFFIITASYVKIFISVLKSGKSHQKALSTCVTHIIVITVSLIFALTAFLSYRINNNMSSDSRVFVSTMYLLFPSCFNPVIYGIRTNEIRQQILKVMKCGKIAPVSVR